MAAPVTLKVVAMHAGPWGAAGKQFDVVRAHGRRGDAAASRARGPSFVFFFFALTWCALTRARHAAPPPAQAARADDSKRVLKAKLEAVTGIPAAQQKLLLSGFSQLAIGDRRSNIRFGTCGRAEGCGIAWEAAAAGKPPHVPPRSANRVDNKGNWTDDGGRGGAA